MSNLRTSASRTYGGVSAADRRSSRRATLIDAALDLFAEGGARAVSKRAVCKRAGLNDRYFYESFADTDALLEAIVGELLTLLLEKVTTAAEPGLDLGAQTHAIARVALEFLAEDPRRSAFLLGSRGSDVLQQGRIDSARTIARAIAAMGGGEPPRSDAGELEPTVVAYALVAGAMEVIEAWFRGEIDASQEQLADLVAGLLAATPAITAALPRPRRRS